MKRFTYQSLPSRVVFGAGSLAELPREIEAMGAQRALVVWGRDGMDELSLGAGTLAGRREKLGLGPVAQGRQRLARAHWPGAGGIDPNTQ